VSITDLHGNLLGLVQRRSRRFQKVRAKARRTPPSRSRRTRRRQAMAHGMREIEVRVKGPGSGRESAIRALQAIGLEVTTIKDVDAGSA